MRKPAIEEGMSEQEWRFAIVFKHGKCSNGFHSKKCYFTKECQWTSSTSSPSSS
jgi:hypothetical protein